MILLKISSKDEQSVLKAAEILIDNAFAVDININSGERRIELVNSKISSTQIFVLTAKTKALLFSKIEKELKIIFHQDIPEIFSLPITTIESSQAEKVINGTLKI